MQDLRLTLFLLLLAPSIVASEMVPLRELGPWLDGRMIFGGMIPLALGLGLTERRSWLGLGLGRPRRGGLGLAVGIPLSVAAVWVLAMSEPARSFYAGHPAEPLGLLLQYLPSTLQVEVCFRGVLLFALLPRLGAVGAAAVAALPYGLVHLDKPLAEALGSVPVGFALGWLAAWTGSIWYGLVLHLVGAISLTLLAGWMA